MNIFSVTSVYSFSNYVISLLKDNVLPSLTAQQKKILLIASVAFSCLASCYLIYRCCFRTKPLTDGNDQNNVLLKNPLVKQDPTDPVAPLLGDAEKPIHNDDIEKLSPISLQEKLEIAKKKGAFLKTLDLKNTDVIDQQLQKVIEACPN